MPCSIFFETLVGDTLKARYITKRPCTTSRIGTGRCLFISITVLLYCHTTHKRPILLTGDFNYSNYKNYFVKFFSH